MYFFSEIFLVLSNTYSEVESEADKIWKLQRYTLVHEYFYRPFLPTPFTIVYYFYELVRWLFYFVISLVFRISPSKPRRFRKYFLSPPKTLCS
jgi:hypothetical protein